MGLWDCVYSSTDFFKRNTPDLTFIKDAGRSSYSLVWAAVTKVDNIVRVNGVQKVNQLLEDDEVRDLIKRSGAIAAKYAAREALKTLPGGSFMHDFGSELIPYVFYKSFKVQNAKTSSLEAAIVGREKAENNQRNMDLSEHCFENSLLSSTVNRKPEEVLSVFMEKGFVGRRLLDALIVPGDKSKENSK